MLRRFDLTGTSPALNLAWDEALLDAAEAGESGEVLRFWESDQPFVVVGHGNRVGTEVNVANCQELGIPILRRCSGGGTVLQGPGCLNYALVFDQDRAPELGNVSTTNAFIMERHRTVLSGLLGQPVDVGGISDLTVGSRKISGNAQRRKRRFLLFHGTFLLQFDFALMERVLRMPSRQPDYRGHRSHSDFLETLGIPSARITALLAGAWGATSPLDSPPVSRANQLAESRYSDDRWHFKF